MGTTIFPVKAILAYLGRRNSHLGPLFITEEGKGWTAGEAMPFNVTSGLCLLSWPISPSRWQRATCDLLWYTSQTVYSKHTLCTSYSIQMQIRFLFLFFSLSVCNYLKITTFHTLLAVYTCHVHLKMYNVYILC